MPGSLACKVNLSFSGSKIILDFHLVSLHCTVLNLHWRKRADQIYYTENQINEMRCINNSHPMEFVLHFRNLEKMEILYLQLPLLIFLCKYSANIFNIYDKTLTNVGFNIKLDHPLEPITCSI